MVRKVRMARLMNPLTNSRLLPNPKCLFSTHPLHCLLDFGVWRLRLLEQRQDLLETFRSGRPTHDEVVNCNVGRQGQVFYSTGHVQKVQSARHCLLTSSRRVENEKCAVLPTALAKHELIERPFRSIRTLSLGGQCYQVFIGVSAPVENCGGLLRMLLLVTRGVNLTSLLVAKWRKSRKILKSQKLLLLFLF